MKNNKMLTVVTILIVTSIIVSSLIYKETLNKVIPIEDSYAYDNNSKVLNNYLEDIKNTLVKEDSAFNLDNYKVSYNEISEDRSRGIIYLTYYINDLIETNKVYMIKIENGKIEDIVSKSVTERTTESEKELLKRVKIFENTKKEKLIFKDNSKLFKSSNILNRDKTINERKLISDINSIDEKYEYNYNTGVLLYSLTIYASTVKEIKIELD